MEEGNSLRPRPPALSSATTIDTARSPTRSSRGFAGGAAAGLGRIVHAETRASDIVGHAKAGLLEHLLDAGPVAEDDVDAVAHHPAGDHAAEGFPRDVVGEKERGDATLGRERGLLHEVGGGVAVAAGILVGATDGEADTLIAKSGEPTKGHAHLAELIVANDGGVGLGVTGVDFGDGEFVPVEREFGEAGDERADHDAGDAVFAEVFGEAAGVVVVLADGEGLELVAEELGLTRGAFEDGLHVRRARGARAEAEILEVGDARGGGADLALLAEAAEGVEDRVLLVTEADSDLADAGAGGLGDAAVIAEGEGDGGDVKAGFARDIAHGGTAGGGRVGMGAGDHGVVPKRRR